MANYTFHDAHLQLTNFIQEGPDIRHFIAMMGTAIGRSTLFGMPLQQRWAYGNTGDFAPADDLQKNAPLYYYSFTDAFIAMAYRSLPPEHQARLDPIITGFNPSDLYAVDHIRRVLLTFPNVFSGIGEFTIHEDFVSATATGEVASLANPALDRILEFAGDVGLPVIIHNDIDAPFPKPRQDPWTLLQLSDLFTRHPTTTIIWAHRGVGRVVRPLNDQVALIERVLGDPELAHLHFDVSWDEVAKYALATPGDTARIAGVLNRFPDRFLFGTDAVAPRRLEILTAVFERYAPLWKLLTPETSESVRLGNYERIFDRARRTIRSWEAARLRDAAAA